MPNTIEMQYLKRRMVKISKNEVVVEVGSWVGKSSVVIGKTLKKYCPTAKFYCVDIFSKEYYAKTPGLEMGAKTDILKMFEYNMKPYKHTTLRMTSVEAAKDFQNECIDFIFIDANHEYEFVKQDINAWWPKVKRGGVMCGHDYCTGYAGVVRAVKECFGDNYSVPAKTIWEAIKK